MRIVCKGTAWGGSGIKSKVIVECRGVCVYVLFSGDEMQEFISDRHF